MIPRRSLSIACLLVGCATPPEPGVGSTGTALEIVQDTAVFKAITVFQLHVFKATTQDGASLTCMDIPGNYRVENPQLVPVLDPAPTASKQQDPTAPVVFEHLRVPADEDLVFVIRGLALYKKGTFVVGRGCLDNQKFKEGSKDNIAIDLKATTGRVCLKPTDCEPNVVCLKGPGFADGYCAVQGCAGGQECPPGSACVSDTAYNGICMRRCDSISDCEIASEVQDCQGRLGLSAMGCPEVCVHPPWQQSNCCSRCYGTDGGI